MSDLGNCSSDEEIFPLVKRRNTSSLLIPSDNSNSSVLEYRSDTVSESNDDFSISGELADNLCSADVSDEEEDRNNGWTKHENVKAPFSFSGNPGIQFDVPSTLKEKCLFYFDEFMDAQTSVIIDVDTGVDDAWALLVFLSSQQNDLEILGITCAKGNTSVDNVCRNTLYILETAGRQEIPVYRGAENCLIQLDSNLSPEYKSYYGSNGFGDVPLSEKTLALIKEENAVVALNRLVEENKGEVTLVCLAPLTNIALAVRTYQHFAKNVKEVFIMGGNYTALGNTTMCAEFNFHIDPEAAHIVLTNFEKKLTLLPWETCFNLKVPFEWRCEVLGESSSSDVINLLNTVEEPVIVRGQHKGYKYWISCDSVLAVLVENPHVISTKFDTHAVIELGGHHTRGQMVIDHLKTRDHNITIVETVKQDMIQNRLLELNYFFKNTI